MTFTNTSKEILTKLTELEQPINTFFQQIWFKPEWFFIFLSGVIGAYVAIIVSKKFEKKKKIHTKSLMKHSISATLDAVLMVFFYPLVWAIGILIVIGLIKTGMRYSPPITLLVLLGLGGFYIWKKKKEELVRRLRGSS